MLTFHYLQFHEGNPRRPLSGRTAFCTTVICSFTEVEPFYLANDTPVLFSISDVIAIP